MAIELLTGALVLITAFYAWATFKILRVNERVVDVMREQMVATTRPYVVVAPVLELDNPIFYLKISNSGRTAAKNLRLSLDKSFFKFGEKSQDKDLANFTAFKQPIDSFPPGSEIHAAARRTTPSSTRHVGPPLSADALGMGPLEGRCQSKEAQGHIR